jgi:hypothetical protein
MQTQTSLVLLVVMVVEMAHENDSGGFDAGTE